MEIDEIADLLDLE